MRKLFILMLPYALVASIIFIAGCAKKTGAGPVPTAAFVFTMVTTALPAEVDFNNTSQNATTYVWDFGDNTSSNVASPKHTYTKAGLYIVKLTATGPGGSATTEQHVTVGNKAMVITSLAIDSADEVANPMYFYATITVDQNTTVLGDYYLPPSTVKYYPVAAWGFKNTVPLYSDVQIKLFYKLPGNNTSYPAGGPNNNTFTFKPVELTESNTNFPSRVSLKKGSGATQNKISLLLTWE